MRTCALEFPSYGFLRTVAGGVASVNATEETHRIPHMFKSFLTIPYLGSPKAGREVRTPTAKRNAHHYYGLDIYTQLRYNTRCCAGCKSSSLAIKLCCDAFWVAQDSHQAGHALSDDQQAGYKHLSRERASSRQV